MKQSFAAMLFLLAITGLVSAQDESASQPNDAGQQQFDSEQAVATSISDRLSSDVQSVSYQLGCASSCCDSPNTGCADLLDANQSCSNILAVNHRPDLCIPNIIGDSFGVPRVFSTPVAGNLLNFPTHITKVADNNNVRPYDRLAFSYNYFTNVPETFDAAGTVLTEKDISEYRIIGEKTILDGIASLNVVIPIYDTIAFEQTGANIQSGTEFGNLAFGGKILLFERANMSASAGVQVEAPTSRGFGFPTVGEVIENESWYLTPYLAGLYTPNDIFFMQSFLSYRARTGSDPVTFRGAPRGEVFQQDLLLADIAAGFWMTRSNGNGITGIAPVVEAHYSTTVENDSPLTFTSIYYGRRDLLNLTLGTHIEFNQRHILSLGYVLPLRDKPLPGGMSTDRAFDGEFSVQMNMYR